MYKLEAEHILKKKINPEISLLGITFCNINLQAKYNCMKISAYN